MMNPAFIHPNGMGLKNEKRDWKNPEDAMKRNVGDLLWISWFCVKSGLFVWKFCHFEEGASLQDEMEREVNDSKARNQISIAQTWGDRRRCTGVSLRHSHKQGLKPEPGDPRWVFKTVTSVLALKYLRQTLTNMNLRDMITVRKPRAEWE